MDGPFCAEKGKYCKIGEIKYTQFAYLLSQKCYGAKME